MIESAEEFVRLRTSGLKEEYDRAALEEAPERVWLDVIERYPDKRKWVAHNKTAPHSILRILADDPDPAVRWWVAMKRKAEPEILDKLSQDPNESVRERVAFNRKAPLWILERLAGDPVEHIAQAARRQIEERAAKH